MSFLVFLEFFDFLEPNFLWSPGYADKYVFFVPKTNQCLFITMDLKNHRNYQFLGFKIEGDKKERRSISKRRRSSAGQRHAVAAASSNRKGGKIGILDFLKSLRNRSGNL